MGLIKSKGGIAQQAHASESQGMSMLLIGLQSEDPDLRRMAARDLIAFPEALNALGDQLEIETDSVVIERIMGTIAQFSSGQAVAVLLPCLRSSDVFKRNLAIEVLKTMPDQIAPYIEELLQDTDPDVRIFTVNVLESLRHPNVVAWLVDVIESDQHVNVCATALDLLAEVGDESCLASLEGLTARFPDQPYLEFAKDTAVERILEHKGNLA